MPNSNPPAYAERIPEEFKYHTSGVPFDPKTRENIDAQITRVAGGLASLVLIDGVMGKGKSTLAVHLADYIAGRSISFEEVLSLGGKEFMKKVDVLTDKKLPVVIYDEAGDFNRRGALQRFNAMLNRFFETYRSFKIIVIVALPNFQVLDKQLLNNGVPRLLLHITRRTKKIGYIKAFSLKRMYYLLENMKKSSMPNLAYSKVNPNYHGYFKNFPPEREASLAEYSRVGKKKIMKETRVNINEFVSSEQIAKHFGRSQGWASQQIIKSNFSPSDKIGNREYFTKDILKTISARTKLTRRAKR